MFDCPRETIWFIYTRKRGTTGLNIGSSSFSIFINELPLVLSYCSVYLNADNTVIYILTQIQNMIKSDFNALQ